MASAVEAKVSKGSIAATRRTEQPGEAKKKRADNMEEAERGRKAAAVAAAAGEDKSAAVAKVSTGSIAATRWTEQLGEAGDGQSKDEQRLKAEAAGRLNRAEAEKKRADTVEEAKRGLKAAAVAAAAALELSAETAKQASATDDTATAAAEKAPT